MPCGWEGNCRCGVTLAVHHWLQWFIHLRKWDKHSAYTACCGLPWHTFYVYLSYSHIVFCHGNSWVLSWRLSRTGMPEQIIWYRHWYRPASQQPEPHRFSACRWPHSTASSTSPTSISRRPSCGRRPASRWSVPPTVWVKSKVSEKTMAFTPSTTVASIFTCWKERTSPLSRKPAAPRIWLDCSTQCYRDREMIITCSAQLWLLLLVLLLLYNSHRFVAYTWQDKLAPPPKNWRILLEQSFTIHMPSMMAASVFWLQKRW